MMDALIASEVNHVIPSGEVCSTCRLHLPLDHFPDGSLVCRWCSRKQMEALRKSAFGGIVREHPLMTSEIDVDVDVFLRDNTQAITDIVQQGVIEHT